MQKQINIGNIPREIVRKIESKVGFTLSSNDFSGLSEDIGHLMYQKTLAIVSPEKAEKLGVDVKLADENVRTFLRSIDIKDNAADEVMSDIHRKIDKALAPIISKGIS
jgi:hypothetical protein